ncbi:hypothetical protein CDO52_12390 [Nocardiopsis gilva YIM 90087]|uniref:CD225/dispanin family protein n=2 Tax=Nocardiopsis gilva TaxID=280236 RepID=A0A223S5T1_9ACTN|nr:CD225/dispanin family protein [Nocardiopsis gilva]ASU83478.1 hypothetical protein CDO52_12390 [Nocardiopsis gilva YIM 90087]
MSYGPPPGSPPPPPPGGGYGPPPPPGGTGGYPGMQQPMGGGQPPSNWLIPAILTIFCCWPAAIPGIVFASQVNSKWNMGDFAGAQDSAGKAKMWTLIALGLGLAFWIVYIILWLIGFGLAASAPATYDTGGY